MTARGLCNCSCTGFALALRLLEQTPAEAACGASLGWDRATERARTLPAAHGCPVIPSFSTEDARPQVTPSSGGGKVDPSRVQALPGGSEQLPLWQRPQGPEYNAHTSE